MVANSTALIRAGVDIGGTFTDVALDVDGTIHSGKVLTDHSYPEQAILDAIRLTADRAGIKPADISMLIHGTTLVTNALIERRGAHTAFITTKGFRDVVEMRNENRFEQYDLNLLLPTPLVARRHRFVVPERMSATGAVLLDVDAAAAADVANAIAEGGYEAVAIGFMHAYANPAHEERMAKAVSKVCPDVSVSISSKVSPQLREFERFNTVCANAYVRPMAEAYLSRLTHRLGDIGVACPVFLMHSGGGLISLETASLYPVRLLESGPAGGAIYAANIALSHGLDKAMSFDMGGTTAKICLINDGKPKTANRFEVARTYRFKKGSGMPVSTPVVEMVEIGAGGGSIASVDDMNVVRVGPQSAGSEPGPACYQRGGEAPTVTDANVILGRIDPENFAGGTIKLSAQLAGDAMNKGIAKTLGLGVGEAAFAVTEMVDENMANAARVHAVENGLDVSQFSLVAFGGGAPLHAAREAEKLGIEQVIVPPGAGVGSAIGFLRAPFSYEETRGWYVRLDKFDADGVNALIESLFNSADSFVRQGVPDARTVVRLTAFMRYRGQGWEIPVEMPHQPFSAKDVELFRQRFEQAYRKLFGRTIDDLEIEIANWSLVVSTIPPKPQPVRRAKREKEAASVGMRQIFDAGLRKEVDAKVVERRSVGPGRFVTGPAVIVEAETATVVTSAFVATGQEDGSLLLSRTLDHQEKD